MNHIHSDKSWVSLAQRQCIICGAVYDTGDLLLDKRMKQSMEKHTVVGHGLCPAHQQMKDDGFVALIEADERGENRTGRAVHIRSSAWPHIFNSPAPAGGVAFAPPEVFRILEETQERSRAAEADERGED